MKINFFEFKNNCLEFKTLIKATSESASRKELKQGQLLFKSIHENIIAMEIKLSDIEYAICRRDLDNRINETIPSKLKIEFEPKFEKILTLNTIQEEAESFIDYQNTTQRDIDLIYSFLDTSFDHEKYIEKIEEQEKNTGPLSGLNILPTKIDYAIKNILEYYSKLSSNLAKYMLCYLKE